MKFVSKRVIYSVDNVSDVANFYRDVFGFEVALDPDFRAEQWSELLAGDFNIGLYPGGISEIKRENRDQILVFYVDNIEQARTHLQQNDVDMGEIEGRGEFKICNGFDPWGFKFQISNRISA